MKMYIVDAFTDKLFAGNPAAVCFADHFPVDKTMQQIAAENRFSETAFAVAKGSAEYDLRWFTPGGEIDLCGHATLATGYLFFRFLQPEASQVVFNTKSGQLVVRQVDGRYQMDFPSYQLKQLPVTDEMTKALGVRPVAAYLDRDLLCVLPTAADVKNCQPDEEQLKQLPGLLQSITAASDDPQYDCVSRSFAPKLAVPEDPVCGSAHCQIVPYWARRLKKKTITAFQASARTGVLYCQDCGDRVKLAGDATLYSSGQLYL